MTKKVVNIIEEQIKQNPFDRDFLITVGEKYLKNKRYREAARTFANLYFVSKKDFLEGLFKLQEERKNNQSEELGLALIDLHLQEKMYLDALFEVESLLEVFPNNVELINILVNISHKIEDKKVLIPVLEKIILLNKKNIRLYEMLANSYVRSGKIKQAIKLYETALEIDPQDYSILNLLGSLYYDAGDHQNAARIYTKILEKDIAFNNVCNKLEQAVKDKVEELDYYFLLARIYRKLVRPSDAVEIYRQAAQILPDKIREIQKQIKDFLRAFPKNQQALFLRVELLICEQQFSEATMELNFLIKDYPKCLDQIIEILYKVISLYPQQVMAHQSLADAFFIKGDYQKTLYFYQKLLDLCEDNVDIIVNRVRNLAKKYPEIEDLAEEVIARSYLKRKQFKRVVQILNDLQQKKQSLSAEGFFTLSQAYLNLNEVDQAILSIRKALAREPYQKKYHQEYKNFVYNKLERSIVELSKVSQENPHKYSLYYLLGKAYFQKNDLDQAINFFQISLKDSLKVGEANKFLGFCFKEKGRFDLATEQFKKSLAKIDENDIEEIKKTQLYLGLTYEAQGERKKAIEIYEQIMVQDLNYKNIDIRIKKLKDLDWGELAGKALLAVKSDVDSDKLVLAWAKNNQSMEIKENVNLPFSLEHNNIGFSLALQGNPKAARQEFYLAQQFDERFNIINNNLAVLFLQENDLTLAKEYLEKGLQEDKNLAVLNANYGTYFALSGDNEQAMEYYKKSLAIDDSLYLTHINLGDLYYLLGDVNNALISWQKALQFGVLPELAFRRLKYTN